MYVYYCRTGEMTGIAKAMGLEVGTVVAMNLVRACVCVQALFVLSIPTTPQSPLRLMPYTTPPPRRALHVVVDHAPLHGISSRLPFPIEPNPTYTLPLPSPRAVLPIAIRNATTQIYQIEHIGQSCDTSNTTGPVPNCPPKKKVSHEPGP